MNSNIENFNLTAEENNFDIAIIGMAGRFPGAENIDQYWQNLCAAKESITFFSDEELIEAGVDPQVLKNGNYIKASPLFGDPSLFDARFFGYSPREASYMDPQHRIFLECAFEALEHAGYNPDTFEGSIGVFGGASLNTYLLLSGLFSNYFNEQQLPILIGNDKDFLTTRVSYKLNLKGPSMTVQTACSTSLVAVHIACQSLLNNECDMALAGGVSIRLPQKAGYFYQEGNIFSPDGHCRAFDAQAKGTIFGSGVGIVVLKRLKDAIGDGDCIHAIIKGSAVNNDGSSKVDYAAPSVNRQAEAILEAMANSGVEADSITYIEAHGTGTALGDPIEITALTNAFRIFTDKKGYCAVGSVKTNIGHLDSAAGVASLIKTVLALKYKQIPPSLHFQKPNQEIDFENSPFYVNRVLSEWKSNQHPLRAGINSLGVGGTNVHVILEEASAQKISESIKPWKLLLLSAKTDFSLETATQNLAHHLKQHPQLNIADVAYTLQVGRKYFNHRRFAICRELDDALDALENDNSNRLRTLYYEQSDRDVVFIFSGQGSQYVNMGLELYKTELIFREQIDHCSDILKSHLSFDLRDILYPDEKDVEKSAALLQQTHITQPALFMFEYALSKLWMAWGVQPAALVGHSIGEYVAACLAGVFSLKDALSLVAARGRLMGDLPGGSMLAVFLPEEEIKNFLDDNLSLSVINGPSLCVVSGKEEAIQYLEKELSKKEIICRYLRTSHAFHSKMMEPVLDAFAEQVNRANMYPPKIPFVSNVTGTWITAAEATNPNYWAKQLRETVRFSDCLSEMLKKSNRILLEVGPGNTFCGLANQHPDRKKEHIILSTTRHPKEKMSDLAFIMETLGNLWLYGIQIDWSNFYAGESRCRLPLPTYPFERKRFWIEAGKKVLTNDSASSSLSEAIKQAHISDGTQPELKTQFADHVPDGDIKKAVANIWKELLGYDKISYNDNFFDLGGSSIEALQLLAEIEKVIGKKLPLEILFQAPTIEQMANILRDQGMSAPEISRCAIELGATDLKGMMLIKNKVADHIPRKYHAFLNKQYHKIEKHPGYLYLNQLYSETLKQPYTKAKSSIIRRFFSYSPSQLEEKLREIGLTEADTIYMHNAFNAFNGFSGGPHQIIDCILDIIGDSGNLLMVSMAYRGATEDYLKAVKTFDVIKTESSMGIITEIFRRKKDVLRSLNPAHPILAFGPDASWITLDHDKTMYSYGEGSPFEKILKLNAKALFFDVPFRTMTFFHYLEDRFRDSSPVQLYNDEPIESTVIDSTGNEISVKTYTSSKEAREKRNAGLLERELKKKKLMTTHKIGNTRLILVTLKDVVDCAQALVNAGTHFYN